VRLSDESPRLVRLGMLAAWALAALLLFSHARHMRDYLEMVGRLGLRGDPQASTPLTHPYPAVASDAMTWVRHALALAEGDEVRLRYTHMDNVPDGREVHWNSGWAWTIAGAGRVHQAINGGAFPDAVEKATVWLTPVALLVAIVVASGWTARRAGLMAGVFVAAAMALHERIREGFIPGYVDHHGLLTVSVLGIVLGAVGMGAGWWRERAPGTRGVLPASPQSVRAAALFSAASGAFGLWVSAASVAPAIAFTGIAGIVTALDFGRACVQRGESFDARAWRLWGRAGALGSLLFYAIEYLPQHAGWHLEVNHPLYALAWLGGGELVARVGERRLRPRDLAVPALAVMAAPAAVAIGGAKVLAFADPFLAQLHRDIVEFLPLWKTLPRFDAALTFRLLVLDLLPLAAAIATLALRKRETPVPLAFAILVAGALEMMAWWQARWRMNASAAAVPLMLLLVVYWTQERPRLQRWAAVGIVVAALYLPGALADYATLLRSLATRTVGPQDAQMVLARDIAAALRAWKPEGEIVMLASPNPSTTVAYYGRFGSLGTLYWENNAGLKAAAELFSEEDDTRIARGLARHRVTHVVSIVDEDYLAQFHALLHPDATPAQFARSFGGRVLMRAPLPAFLRRLPYEPPDDLAYLKANVAIYEVVR
jgi:hypothetical protein